MKRKQRQLLTTEDWDKPIDTLLKAQNWGEEKIFLHRATDEQLKAWKALLKEECERLEAGIRQPYGSRLDELKAKMDGLWNEIWQQARENRRARGADDTGNVFAAEDADPAWESETGQEYFRVRGELWELQELMEKHPESNRLVYVEGVLDELESEQERRANDDDEEDDQD